MPVANVSAIDTKQRQSQLSERRSVIHQNKMVTTELHEPKKRVIDKRSKFCPPWTWAKLEPAVEDVAAGTALARLQIGSSRYYRRTDNNIIRKLAQPKPIHIHLEGDIVQSGERYTRVPSGFALRLRASASMAPTSSSDHSAGLPKIRTTEPCDVS